MASSVTFVTAYLSIYHNKNDNNDNNYQWRYDRFERYNKFKKLAESGIQLCLFTDSLCYEELSALIENYPNVKMMNMVNLEDLFSFTLTESLEYTLPSNRDTRKDTNEYMFVQHSKIDFVDKVIQENPWNSTHFAWIDFSAVYIFNEPIPTLNYLNFLSKQTFITRCFLFPGCWPSLEKNSIEPIWDSIYWRFCGTFFLGDSTSITYFRQLCRDHLESFIREREKLVWEVNFWAWLEANTEWKPDWYIADHNHSIFNIPSVYYVECLDNKLQKTHYSYPEIQDFFPSNTAYVNHQDQHLLNTRFINYSYYPNGRYNIRHKNGVIVTKNILVQLDSDLLPTNYSEMDESTIGLVSHYMYSMGLEDIRLYSFQDHIKFIATNVNYIGKPSNRMIIGEYDHINHTYKDCKIIQPPTNTHCEKNWIPIIHNAEEYFVYKWSPFEVGKINPVTEQLEIIQTYEINSPFFHKVRGSTIFMDHSDSLLGLVHYSEETTPRQYYHLLVTLDKTTLKPIFYSDPFCFQHYGVEFCIGFTVQKETGRYVFWVSKSDIDTVMVSLPIDQIPICHSVIY